MPDIPVSDPNAATVIAAFRQGVGPDVFDNSSPGQTLRQRSTKMIEAANMPTMRPPAPGELPTLVKPTAPIQSRSGAAPHSATALIGHGQESLARASEFTIHAMVGKGGMGQVFRAGQNALRREVAIKKIIPEHLEKATAQQMEQAFVAEALITGYLDHPNIVPVYSLGRDEGGSWFFTMKMVHGTEWRHLLHPGRCKDAATAERARAHKMDIDSPERRDANLIENLRLLLTVCHAVAFAHSRKIIHRDLKPENIMVGSFGEVLVMDWGLAVDVSDHPSPPGSPGRRVPTRHECGMGGTPSYMAPEQIENDATGRYSGENLNCWTDVFLLGAMLHELLTGDPPYSGNGIGPVLVKVAACQPPTLPPTITPELAAICLKALAKNPRERYPDALAFQNALNHYLKHKESAAISAKAEREAKVCKIPNLARAVVLYDQALELWPDNQPVKDAVQKARTDLDFLEKCAQRTRRGLAIAVVCIVAGLAFGFFWTRRERQLLGEQHRQTLLAKAEESKAREKAVLLAHEAHLNLAHGLIAQGDASIIADRFMPARIDYQKAWTKLEELNEPAFAAEWGLWEYYHEVDTPLLTLSNSEAKNGLGAVQFSPDGSRALSSGSGTALRLWDLTLGIPIREMNGHTGTVLFTAFSSDGKSALTGGSEGDIRLWNLEKGTQVHAFEMATKSLKWVAFSSDEKHLLAGCGEKIKLWDAVTGADAGEIKREAIILSEAYAPAVNRTLSGGVNNVVTHWNAASAGKIAEFNKTNDISMFVLGVALTADGKRGLSGGTDKIARLWDLGSSSLLRELKGHRAAISSVALSADGSRALTGSWDHTLRLWNAESGAQFTEFIGHTSNVVSVALSRDGRSVLSRSLDRTLRLWIPDSRLRTRDFSGHTKGVECLAVSPDGKLLFSGGRDFALKLWDIKTGLELKSFQGFAKRAAFLPDGKHVISGSDIQSLVQIWDLETSSTSAEFKIPFKRIAFSSDGKRVLSGGEDKIMRVFSLEDGKPIRQFSPAPGAFNSVAFSHDGKQALSCCDNNTMQIWDVDKGTVIHEFASREGALYCAAFSNNGKRVATGGIQGVVQLWDLEKTEATELGTHAEQVTSIAFSPDDLCIVTSSKDKTVKLWEVASAGELREFQGHTNAVYESVFSPDSKQIFSAGEDGNVKLWDGAYAARYREFESKLPLVQMQLAANPKDEQAREVLGNWFAFRGVDNKAVTILEDAPANLRTARAHVLASSFLKLGDYAKALHYFEQELSDARTVPIPARNNSKERDALVANCFRLNLCIHALHRQNIDAALKKKDLPGYVAAIQVYLAVLERDIPSPRYRADNLNHYAWDLLNLHEADFLDPKAALPMAKRAVELTAQKDPACLDTLAWALFKNGLKAEAVETQKKAISVLPKNTPAKRLALFEEDLKTFEANKR